MVQSSQPGFPSIPTVPENTFQSFQQYAVPVLNQVSYAGTNLAVGGVTPEKNGHTMPAHAHASPRIQMTPQVNPPQGAQKTVSVVIENQLTHVIKDTQSSMPELYIIPEEDLRQYTRCTGDCKAFWRRKQDAPRWSSSGKPWCDACGLIYEIKIGPWLPSDYGPTYRQLVEIKTRSFLLGIPPLNPQTGRYVDCPAVDTPFPMVCADEVKSRFWRGEYGPIQVQIPALLNNAVSNGEPSRVAVPSSEAICPSPVQSTTQGFLGTPPSGTPSVRSMAVPPAKTTTSVSSPLPPPPMKPKAQPPPLSSAGGGGVCAPPPPNVQRQPEPAGGGGVCAPPPPVVQRQPEPAGGGGVCASPPPVVQRRPKPPACVPESLPPPRCSEESSGLSKSMGRFYVSRGPYSPAGPEDSSMNLCVGDIIFITDADNNNIVNGWVFGTKYSENPCHCQFGWVPLEFMAPHHMNMPILPVQYQ